MSKTRTSTITPWSIGVIVAVLAVSFWTMTAQGEKYMQPGGLRGEHSEKKIACDACHQPLLGTPDVKCISCHKDVGQEQETRQGRHAAMIGACYRCHIMHRATTVGTGVDETGVDHSLVGFGLEKHEGQKCGDCHSADLKTKREQINAVCARCHAWPQRTMGSNDPQATALQPKSVKFGDHKLKAGDDCIKCHTGGSNVAFKHVSEPQGEHARLTCEKCHRGGLYGGLNWTCAGCHSAPGGHFAAACTECHKTTANWRADFNHPGMEEHSSKSFPCNYCHPAGTAAVDCRRCHDSVFPRDD